jgi:hypothetical protein
MEIGTARGTNIWPLESGRWAWSAWDHRQTLSGTEDTEMRAQAAASHALEQIIAEGRLAAPDRRELPSRDDRKDYCDIQG